ncbi:MAG: hypothetical protein AAFO80_08240 [Pseudomonadota bacterium]
MDANATMTNAGLGIALGHNGPPAPPPLEGLDLLRGCLEFAQETRRQVDADVATNGLAACTFVDMHIPALTVLGAAVLKADIPCYSRLGWLGERLSESVNRDDDRALHWRVRIFDLLDEIGIVDASEELSYDARKAFEGAEWAALREMVA